jgi:hypothetical protein
MMGIGVRENSLMSNIQVSAMLRKNRPSGSERHALTCPRGSLMAVDLPGLAIVAGLLLPALAAAAWAIALERRRPRRSPAGPASVLDPEPEPDFTVAGIKSRIRQEHAVRQLAEARTVALPTLPIPAQTRRESTPEPLPARVAGSLPPRRPAAARVPASRFAFAPPDTDLMRRILDGLRKMD